MQMDSVREWEMQFNGLYKIHVNAVFTLAEVDTDAIAFYDNVRKCLHWT